MKKLLIALAAIVVLVIIAAIAVPFLIPLDTYKTRVIALVKAETGRDLAIAGPVHLSLLPSLALEANDVSLSNPPGASTPQMAQIKTLTVRMKLWPLLHGAIAIDRFELVQPVIALEIDKQGRPNWRFSPPATPSKGQAQATAPAPAPTPGGGGAGFPDLSLATVNIVDGQASYLDQRSGTKRVLSNINVSLSLPSPDRPLSANGSAVWNGETATLTAQLAQPGALQSGGSSPVAITLAAKPVNFSFKGNATGITLEKLDGGIDLSIPSVRGFAQWLGVAFNPPGTGFGPMTVSGQVAMAGRTIAFSKAVISLDGAKANGALSLDSSGKVPNVSGHLDVDKLDLNPYLPPQSKAPGSPANAAPPAASGSAAPSPSAAPTPSPGQPAAAGSGWSDTPIDLAPLKLANADFTLTTGALIYRKITLGHSALALQIKDGKLDANLSQMALYQGNGQGKVTVDGTGPTPALALTFNLTNVAVQPLLRDAMGFDRLVGTGSFVMDVAGHGGSQRAIIATLGGKGSFNLANGKIEGVDLTAFMKKTGTAVANTLQGHGGGETDFGALTGTYTITDGILHNNDLKLVSPDVPMTGAGTVDLPKQTVSYRLTPSVAGVAVPVDITGPWANLSYKPDLSALAKDLPQAAGKLLQKLDKGSSGSSSGLGGMLKGLLGH